MTGVQEIMHGSFRIRFIMPTSSHLIALYRTAGPARSASRPHDLAPNGAPWPLSNGSWAEVFRAPVTLRWYAQHGVAEGINYGCWFYSLHPPYSVARGSS